MYAGFLGDNIEQMSVADCIDAYAVAFQSSRGNLLLVSNDMNRTSFFSDQGRKDWRHDERKAETFSVQGNPFSWICAGSTRADQQTCESYLAEIRGRPNNWRPLGPFVNACYSQKTDEHCKLFFSILSAGLSRLSTLSRLP